MEASGFGGFMHAVFHAVTTVDLPFYTLMFLQQKHVIYKVLFWLPCFTLLGDVFWLLSLRLVHPLLRSLLHGYILLSLPGFQFPTYLVVLKFLCTTLYALLIIESKRFYSSWIWTKIRTAIVSVVYLQQEMQGVLFLMGHLFGKWALLFLAFHFLM